MSLLPLLLCLWVYMTSAQHHDHKHTHFRHYHRPSNSSGVVSLLKRLVALNNNSLTSFSVLNSTKVLHSLEGLEENAHDLVRHLIEDGGVPEGEHSLHPRATLENGNSTALTLEGLPGAIEEFKRNQIKERHSSQHRICTKGGIGEASSSMYDCAKDLDSIPDELLCGKVEEIINVCAHNILVKCFTDTGVRELKAILFGSMSNVMFENTGQRDLLKKCDVAKEFTEELQANETSAQSATSKCTAEQIAETLTAVNICTHHAVYKRNYVFASDPSDRRKLFCDFIEEAIVICPKLALRCLSDEQANDWMRISQKGTLSVINFLKVNTKFSEWTGDLSECTEHPELLALVDGDSKMPGAAGDVEKPITSSEKESHLGDERHALHRAALNGNFEEAKQLIESGVSFNRVDVYGQTPLHLACQKGSLKVAEFLVEKGADVNAATSDGLTPLCIASIFGHPTIVQLLIKSGSEVEKREKEGLTPLHLASREGHIEVAMLLLDNGANVNALSKNSTTPLHTASKEGHLEVVKLLIEKKAEVSKGDTEGFTSLHFACLYGHLPVALLLIEKGANVNVKSINGNNPLRQASFNGHIAVVRLLIEMGADVNIQDNEGFTPLKAACFDGHLAIVQLLIENGAEVDKADINGFTPLYIACQSGYLEVVKLLIEKGADINRMKNNGFTPLHAASYQGHLTVVKFLIESGANLNAKSHVGITPLFSAADNNHFDVAQFLIEKGAGL